MILFVIYYFVVFQAVKGVSFKKIFIDFIFILVILSRQEKNRLDLISDFLDLLFIYIIFVSFVKNSLINA